jgi:hypothetical protein
VPDIVVFHPVNAVGVRHLIIAQFVRYVLHDEQAGGNSDGQTDDIDRGIYFVPEDIPSGNDEIIP